MRRTAFLLATLAAVALLSPACGFNAGDVAVGDCFKTGAAAAFSWDAEVSCDEPHTVEVFAVSDVSRVSPTLGQYSRAELQDDNSPARQQYLALVSGFCEREWSEYTGFGDLGSSLVPDAVVLPAVYGHMALEAVPAAEWDGGKKAVICYQVFGHPGTGDEQATEVSHQVLRELGRVGGDVPPQVRDCATSLADGKGEQRVSCGEPHDREYLGHLDLAQFRDIVPGLDQAFLDSFDSTTASDEDWALLDGVCRQIFPPLLGGDREDIKFLAQIYTDEDSWGWADKGSYHAACFARPDRQVTRSLVGIGDGQF
ncbi:MAG: septum formation family protein [Pseudonocardiaceae bacterium]